MYRQRAFAAARPSVLRPLKGVAMFDVFVNYQNCHRVYPLFCLTIPVFLVNVDGPFGMIGALGTNGGEEVFKLEDPFGLIDVFGTYGGEEESSFEDPLDLVGVLGTNGGNVGSSFDVILDTKDQVTELSLVGILNTKNGGMGLIDIHVFGMNGGQIGSR